MLRFLDSADLDTATLADCPGLAERDKAEDDRRDDTVYWSLPVRERVAILKFLCELQFDRNDKLAERIDGEDADAMVGLRLARLRLDAEADCLPCWSLFSSVTSPSARTPVGERTTCWRILVQSRTRRRGFVAAPRPMGPRGRR
jgi:hypothetical protein